MSSTASSQPQLPAAPSREQLLTEIEDLRTALQTRDVIGQAKGIIRLLTATGADQAFTLLSQISQDTNLPVRDLAALIAERAGIGQLLPADIMASWQRHTGTNTTQPARQHP